MARPRSRALDYMIYLVVRTVEMFVRILDVGTAYRLFGRVGDIAHRFDRRHRHRAMEHLRRSFPDLPQRQLQAVARSSMRSLLYLALEVMLTTRRITPGGWRRHVRLGNLGPALRLALEQKTGLILVTGHFGNWEALGYAMAVLGFPSVAVARPPDNPYLSDYLMGVREKTGQSILYKRGATQTMNDVLEAKGTLSFIADQDAGPRGLFVRFLGRLASTYKSVGLMAIRHCVPVAVAYGRRVGERYCFQVGVQRIIYPHEWAGKDDPLLWITQEYTSALEEMVRQAPEQYVWTHRRWKHRPKGEQPGPDGVA